MKMRLLVAASGIGLIFQFFVCSVAVAAEVKVLSGFGMRVVMMDLGPKFERATGHKLVISYANAGPIAKRVQDGEVVDVILLNQPAIDGIVRAGKAVAANVRPIARSGIGLAVRKGAPRPDISTPEALKHALLAAKSVTYQRDHLSGRHFAKVLDRLGIADEMKAKTVFATSSEAVAQNVAHGKAEIGMQQLQNFVVNSDVEILGPLPGDLRLDNVIGAVIMTSVRDAAAAKSLVDFLRTPEAAPVIKAKGMEPAAP